MPGKQRLRWIDIAKGICIVSIIVGHQGFPHLGFVYLYHLPVFFLLSGFTLKKGPLDAAFLRSKFSRLMTPYFLTGFAVLGMNLVNMALREGRGSVMAATENIAGSLRAIFFASGANTACGSAEFPVIGAVWFLPALLFALVLARFLLHRIADGRIAAVIAAAASALSAISATYIWLPFSVQAGVYACPFVLAGYFLREKGWLETPKRSHLLLSGGVFLAGVLTKAGAAFYMVSATASDLLLTPVIALSSGYFILLLSRLPERLKLPRALTLPAELCGRYSLEILCIHLFEMNTLGFYYAGILARIGLENRALFRLLLRFCVIAVLTALLLTARRLFGRYMTGAAPEGKRDPSVDLLRAGLIVSMVAGHFALDPSFRGILYSVHMPAFILISGYFHKPVRPENFKKQLWHTVKGLRYYLLFALLYMAEHAAADWPRLLVGISYARRLFTDVPSVGPAYFFLLLFVVKFVCLLIDRIPVPWVRYALLAGCVIGGVALGRAELWLPWSADAALFCVAFYHAGFLLRKYRAAEWARANPWCYFLLSPVWLYMVSRGSLELAVRNYGENVGLALLGSCCGFLILLTLCGWFSRKLPGKLVGLLGKAGEATAYILILHTLYGVRLNALLDRLVNRPLGLPRDNALFWALTVLLQTVLGTAAFCFVRLAGRLVKNRIRPGELPSRSP